MKNCLLFLVFLSGFNALASVEHGASLVSLRPSKVSEDDSALIGRLSATLTDEKDQKVVSLFSQKFGDCEGCARGISLKGALGIRFDGKKLASLHAVRKQSSEVKGIRCSRGAAVQNNAFLCKFNLRETAYSLAVNFEE